MLPLCQLLTQWIEVRKFKQEWKWDFAHGAANPSTIAGDKWGRRAESMAEAGGMGPTLLFNIRHKDNPDGNMEINPNPSDQGGQPRFNAIKVEDIKRPGAGQMPQNATFTNSFTHPNLLGHVDTAYLRLTVPNAGMVDGKEQHCTKILRAFRQIGRMSLLSAG